MRTIELRKLVANCFCAETILRYNKFDEFWMVKKMKSDFHVRFPQETAGLLAHMANQKNIDITTLITELAIEELSRSEQKTLEVKDASHTINAKETWSAFSNKFDESEWTWPDL